MSPWTAFADGTARVWFHKRVVLWLYLINFVFAAVLVFPLRKVAGVISRTDLSNDFVSGFHLDSFIDLWSQYSSELKSMGYVAVGLGAVYLLVNIFVTGGVIATLAAGHRVSLRRFFYTASRYFGRYLRLFILLAVVIGAVVAACWRYLKPLLEDLEESATTDRAAFLWRGLAVVIMLVLASLIVMVFDYAKIRTVIDGRRSMILAAGAGFAFSFRRPLRTVSLFYVNFVIVSILLVIGLYLESRFPGATVTSLVSLFVVQQIFILTRLWMRVSFFSTQMAFYQGVCEALAPPQPTETAPAPSTEVASVT